MAKLSEASKTVTIGQDEYVNIYVEGIGAFITVYSMRDDKTDDQTLAIKEWLNEETIYINTIPAE